MHPLELVLQLQVGSDQTAVLCLPSIVSSLTSSHFEPSPHLSKWTLRVTSLIQSKYPGARWAGLCLALHSSTLSKDSMIESAQHWIAITLPMLSRNETPPTLKACIRLLDFIFSSAINLPEFQRQLATPNIPKFSAALLNLAEKSQYDEIKHISLLTLTHLIPIYPTLHRQLHPSLHSLSFHLLSGSSVTPTPAAQVERACNLHCVLHFTGGKVGAAPLWRKSLDKALANAWSALVVLRTTYPKLPRSTLINEHSAFEDFPTDPAVAVPLGLDRLRCSMSLINHLLRVVTPRAVPVPIGELTKLALCLLRCEPDEKMDIYYDPSRRAFEISVLPEIWKIGCELIAQLSKTLQHKLTPHLSRILSLIVPRLEKLPRSHRVWFLRPLPSLLSHTYTLHSPTQANRIVKVLLPLLTTLLPRRSEVQPEPQAYLITSAKGKRRARGYEGDEVFKVGRDVLCPTPEDVEAIDVTLEALIQLLFNPHLSVPVRTLTARLFVTLLYELPRCSPSMLSPDLSFQGRVHAKVLSICHKCVLAGASGWINSAMGLIVNGMSIAMDGDEATSNSSAEAQRVLDLLLHPRLPPLLRSQPAIEDLSLFRGEHTKDDEAIWDAAGLSRDSRQLATETITGEVPTSPIVDIQSHTAAPQQLRWTTQSAPKAPHMAPLTPTIEGPEVGRLLESTRTNTITDQTPSIAKSSIQEVIRPDQSSAGPQRLTTNVATLIPVNKGLVKGDKTQQTTDQIPSSVKSSIREIIQPKPASVAAQQSSAWDETSRDQVEARLIPVGEGLDIVKSSHNTESTADQTSSIVKSLIQDIVQGKAAFGRKYSGALGMTKGEDNNSDEEMPEIDMRSDSD